MLTCQDWYINIPATVFIGINGGVSYVLVDKLQAFDK